MHGRATPLLATRCGEHTHTDSYMHTHADMCMGVCLLQQLASSSQVINRHSQALHAATCNTGDNIKKLVCCFCYFVYLFVGVCTLRASCKIKKGGVKQKQHSKLLYATNTCYCTHTHTNISYCRKSAKIVKMF